MFTLMLFFHILHWNLSWISYCLGIWMTIQFIFYFIIHIFQYVISYRHPVSFQGKYGTEWALVTGGSTGIGSEICNELADMGMNLIILALDDEDLRKKISELTKRHRKQRFVPVGLDLRTEEPVARIKKVLEQYSVDCGVVINNAGYLTVGKFEDIPVDEQIDNFRVNSLSYFRISHYFYHRWIREERGSGLIAFNCSCSGSFYQPYSIMYGASKAFDQYFTSSLAIEAFRHNINITTFNPQMVTSKHFYQSGSDFIPIRILSSLWPTTPKSCAQALLKTSGRTYVRNHGWFSHMLFFVKILFFGVENIMIVALGFGIRLFGKDLLGET